MRLRIRWKLLLGIGTPLAVLSALSLLVSFRAQRDEALRSTESQLTKDAQFYAARFDTQMEMLAQVARSTASFLSAHPDVTEPELYEMLRLNVAQSPLIYGSCVAFEPYDFSRQRRLFAPYVYKGAPGQKDPGPDGLFRMDVANAYDYTEPKWEWFNGPRTTREPMWTEPFFDDGAGNVIMCTYVAPFFRSGAFRGTVNIDVKLEDLQMVVNRMLASDVTVSILSRKGTFVSWPIAEVIMHETAASLGEKLNRPDLAELGKRMTTGHTATERMMSLDLVPVPMLISYAPLRSTGWSFGVSVDEAKAVEPVYAGLRYNALVAGAVIVIVVGITLLVALWLTRPIERLAAAVARVKIVRGGIGGDGLDEPTSPPELPVRGRDEIGDLGRAFNTMVAQLNEQVRALTRETKARESVESEVRIAREIQQSLLPRVFPPFPERTDFDLHAFNGAAKMVAGDFYDFQMLPDGRLSVVIADVCGKGIPAAMYMAVARTVLRNLAQGGHTPGELLNQLNTVLLQDNTQGLFVTLIVALYEPATGRVVYANGGHPRPYVLSSDGRCRPFGVVTGTIVGVLEDQSWTEGEERLEPGDTVVMFTDGVTDARRPGAHPSTVFGEARLVELLSGLSRNRDNGHGPLKVREVSERIIARLHEYATSDWPDDVTLLVLGRGD